MSYQAFPDVRDSEALDGGQSESVLDRLHLTRQNQANARPCTSDPVQILYLTKGYTVKLKAGTKKVTLLRFLLAKMVYGREHEGLSLEEFLVIHEVFYQLLESEDPLLSRKWDQSFNKIGIILRAIADTVVFPLVLEDTAREVTKDFLREDPILPKPEAYYGLMGNRDLRSSFKVHFQSSWIPPKKVERYIGVGYKDKGTRRCPELDGSPSWQRVATVLCNQERMVEEAGQASSAHQGGEESTS